MSLADVKHQPIATGALARALSTQQVPHAWLFSGPDGVGKELAALALAQALLCPEKPFVGCGTCAACQRVSKRSHPDLTWLMPEDEGDEPDEDGEEGEDFADLDPNTEKPLPTPPAKKGGRPAGSTKKK
jgi:DNA polymerase III delta prime subunit